MVDKENARHMEKHLRIGSEREVLGICLGQQEIGQGGRLRYSGAAYRSTISPFSFSMAAEAHKCCLGEVFEVL
jgi:anthranilate/para-aminobenzoate synthase component II